MPIHKAERSGILYLCPTLEFRDFFSGYERLASVYLGCQSEVSAWNNTGNSAAKETVVLQVKTSHKTPSSPKTSSVCRKHQALCVISESKPRIPGARGLNEVGGIWHEKTLRLHGSDRLAVLQAALNEALAAPGAADASPAPQQPSSNRHKPGKAAPDSRAFASERKRQTDVQEYCLPHLSM
ncbi:hypothetical protein Anapl_00681 [Anas platyrhynchos]|uniref:Uncharacterized protein n=1 Tax=Anas platyrhynchos TaxID=8839 RepID=R0LSC9_ANAPL|nr:hypothetical protein Anapl_00681 [Anas platyrhynchos]